MVQKTEKMQCMSYMWPFIWEAILLPLELNDIRAHAADISGYIFAIQFTLPNVENLYILMI
jgi:hypothetical protein